MYDPNQPRIPEGHHGGGRWTRGGYGFLSDVGKLRPPSQRDDEAAQAPDGRETLYDLYLPSDLDRMRPERGDQYARVGGFRPPRNPFPDLASRIGAALASAVALFESWSRRNDADWQTVASFRSREFVADGQGLIIPEQVRTLDRQTVIAKICESLDDIENLLDDVLKEFPQKPGETNAQYGSRIHKALADKIKKDYGGMKAEVSLTVEKPDVPYGTDGSIRIDVLEDLGNGTACIYDFKTGKKGILDPGRMFEIAHTTFAAQDNRDPNRIRRIIVTQVKPGQGKSSEAGR
jgi:hypothetical protein